VNPDPAKNVKVKTPSCADFRRCSLLVLLKRKGKTSQEGMECCCMLRTWHSALKTQQDSHHESRPDQILKL
jgi:hypothetical protein